MKNLYLKQIILVSILTISILNIKKSYALDPFTPLIFGVNTAQKIWDTANDVKDYLAQAQTVYNTYQSGKALVQQVKNINLSTFAQNIGSDQILQYSSMILGAASGSQGIGVNIATKGNQIITNLGNYKDKIGFNEIKKMISDFKSVENTTPYTNDMTIGLLEKAREKLNSLSGRLVNFTLPYIARNEICYSDKLKDIIKNGEPSTYIKPKQAVGNVAIDALCGGNQNLSAEEQATFIGLAKAGYAGPQTRVALADPANTPAGVVGSAVSKAEDLSKKTVDDAAEQAKATGLNVGQQVCFGKDTEDGKSVIVKQDPTSKEKADTFCYSQNSSVAQSGAMLNNRTAAALLGPYFSMLARASATNDEKGKCDKESEGYDPSTKNQVMCGLSKASKIMDTITSIINIGAQDNSAVDSGQYGRLTADIERIAALNGSQADLYALSNAAQQEYEKGGDQYTLEDLKNRVELYENIRNFNTNKLNEMVFTYAFLELAAGEGLNSISKTAAQAVNYKAQSVILSIFNPLGNLFGGGSRSRSSATTAANTAAAVAGIKEAMINVSRETRLLIKEMAANNYAEQQMAKLLEEFRNTDSAIEDNQDALKSVLDNAITQKRFGEMQIEWNYIPRFVDANNDPTAPQTDLDTIDKKGARLKEEARQSVLLIPPKDERIGPYTDQNILYLRVRAWKTYLKGGGGNFSRVGSKAPSIPELFKRYDMPTKDDIDPNLPLIRNAKVVNVLEPAQVKTWSELKICNSLGLTNTICDEKIIKEVLFNYQTITIGSIISPDEIEGFCANVPAGIDKECAKVTEGDLKQQCTDPTQKQSLLTAGQEFCADGPSE